MTMYLFIDLGINTISRTIFITRDKITEHLGKKILSIKL